MTKELYNMLCNVLHGTKAPYNKISEASKIIFEKHSEDVTRKDIHNAISNICHGKYCSYNLLKTIAIELSGLIETSKLELMHENENLKAENEKLKRIISNITIELMPVR